MKRSIVLLLLGLIVFFVLWDFIAIKISALIVSISLIGIFAQEFLLESKYKRSIQKKVKREDNTDSM